jgi:hypothetical protein
LCELRISLDEVIRKLKPYEALGVDHFTYCATFGLGFKEQKRSLELFINEVMPAFAEPESEQLAGQRARKRA